MRRFISAVTVALFLTGCGSGTAGISININGSKQATEERNLTALHVAGSGVEVTTSLGAVDIAADAALKEVTITAKSGNGSVNVTKAGGVDARSSMGAVTVRDAAGDVAATSGNGSVVIAGVKGSLKAHTSMGRITIANASGRVDADSGNGSIECAAGGGVPIHLNSSMGLVNLTLPPGAAGSIKADTSLGSVTVDGPRKPKSVTSNSGSKTVVLTDAGPASTVRCGNGSITITLE